MVQRGCRLAFAPPTRDRTRPSLPISLVRVSRSNPRRDALSSDTASFCYCFSVLIIDSQLRGDRFFLHLELLEPRPLFNPSRLHGHLDNSSVSMATLSDKSRAKWYQRQSCSHAVPLGRVRQLLGLVDWQPCIGTWQSNIRSSVTQPADPRPL